VNRRLALTARANRGARRRERERAAKSVDGGDGFIGRLAGGSRKAATRVSAAGARERSPLTAPFHKAAARRA